MQVQRPQAAEELRRGQGPRAVRPDVVHDEVQTGNRREQDRVGQGDQRLVGQAVVAQGQVGELGTAHRVRECLHCFLVQPVAPEVECRQVGRPRLRQLPTPLDAQLVVVKVEARHGAQPGCLRQGRGGLRTEAGVAQMQMR